MDSDKNSVFFAVLKKILFFTNIYCVKRLLIKLYKFKR